MSLGNNADSAIQGAKYLTLAKVYFVISSYIIYISLARILSAADFGIYGVVIGLTSIINMVFVMGTIQSVSKYTSENESLSKAVKSTAFRIQIFLGGGLFLLYFFGAPITGKLLNDTFLSKYLRIASFIILFYAFYAIFIGFLNGRREFKKQAIFDIGYSTIKIALILAFAYMFRSSFAAIGGFSTAAFLILLISFIVIGFQKSGDKFSVKKLLDFQLTIMAFTFVANMIINTDLFMIKALSESKVANIYSGYYTACLTVARIPYMIIVSLNLVLFPVISKAVYNKQSEEVAKYIVQGFRICFMVVLLLAAIISSSSGETLSFLYPEEYQTGSISLTIISLGYVFLSLFIMACTIISGGGHPKVSLGFGVVVLLSGFGINYFCVPKYGMSGAALGTSFSFAIGVLISGVYILKKYDSFMDIKATSKILLSGLIIYLLSSFMTLTGPALIAKDIGLVVVYLLLLVIFKELKSDDWDRLKEISFYRKGHQTA